MEGKIKHLELKYALARYSLIKECEADELRLYLYLKLYAINKHEAFPTYKTIKDDLGWGEGKISKVIKRSVKAGHLKVGKKEIKTRVGKQPANIYDITWYDLLNDKGVSKQRAKGFPNGNTLFDKGVSKSEVEPLLTITNRNITNRDYFIKSGNRTGFNELRPAEDVIKEKLLNLKK